ncbi:hypothetical protein BCR36DRAFT_588266 [Piromyces finnis]|uniref:Uncharacterized protein n=1 Tax=Piromyces finnis TaxID=1754191 RepID=A0A1Y1UN39_9FUNG|nr:hypothetical protein BCR36DRAFT_588266 [Piromyces finnis]|eukprot:ORX39471.1 hypothetical protein BCR36DRAFT_588266 [Piromyces finnis]
MKLLSIITLAILNFCLVSAIPTKVQRNGKFIFWITGASSGKCSIYGLDSEYKNAKEIIVPSYFVVEGEKYYVTEIMNGAFANEKFEKVTFDFSGRNDVELIDSSFLNCKNLKEIYVIGGQITVNSNAFTGTKDVIFNGPGYSTFAKRLGEKLLKSWGLPVNYKGYEEAGTESRNKKMTDLYKLAKKIKENFNQYNWGSAGNNFASIIIYRTGNIRGLHMVYRELARIMGVDANTFLTVSDGSCTFWSYIQFKYDKWYDTWYSVDIINYNYSKYTGSTYPSDFFMKTSKVITHLSDISCNYNKDPSKWYVYLARFGSDYDYSISTRELIDDYIKKNKLGGDRA